MFMETIVEVQSVEKVMQKVTMHYKMQNSKLRREEGDKLLEKNKSLELSKNVEASQQF